MGNKRWMLLLGFMLALGACGDVGGGAVEEEAPAGEMENGAPLEEGNKGQATEEVPVAQSGEASEVLANGEAARFAFNEAGQFDAFCELHPSMKMTVIVEEGAEISGETSVSMADMAFSEQSLTVAPGTIVTWTNEDTAQHNVAFE